MLTSAQRERILSHLRRGWKLHDSLVQELWTAYETLEQSQSLDDQQPSLHHLSDRPDQSERRTHNQPNSGA